MTRLPDYQIPGYLTLQEHIARIKVARIASDLVKIPSCSLTEHREAGAAAYIYKILCEEGIPVELAEVEPGSLQCDWRDKRSGKG